MRKKAMTNIEIERLSEKMADNFSVYSDQMPLSREQIGTIGDIFYTAIMEITENDMEEKDYEFILKMSERLAERMIGKMRADFHKEVYEALKKVVKA